jgi:hypothetical protein
MRKIQVNRGNKPVEPTSEQIRKHKDFARLSHEYDRLTKRPRKPLYKDPKLFLLIFIILLILFVVFMESRGESPDNHEDSNEIESAP